MQYLSDAISEGTTTGGLKEHDSRAILMAETRVFGGWRPLEAAAAAAATADRIESGCAHATTKKNGEATSRAKPPPPPPPLPLGGD
ncbi:unnamed protein product [Caenorhabditis bovis]|uniref:Uncharacterized protein n=1 Tax=Caenorhabditis bovis TaxID=2654633 RepID=A0A8S1F6E7_9PELO|nr:unnamed protein product [Caenorhabditis bovis]